MEDQRTDFYVYAYRDPNTLEPFYIGKGLNGRIDIHLVDARNPRHTTENYYNPTKLNMIRDLLENDQEPIIEKVCTDLVEEDAFDLETFLIQEIGRLSHGEGPLTNMTLGGEGMAGIIKDKTIYHLVNSFSGEEAHVTQYQMHLDLGLTQSGACWLVSGTIQSSSGWRLASNENTKVSHKGIKLKFVNAYTGEVVHKTQNEMVEDHGVTIAPISMVASGTYTQTKGWCLNEVPDDFVYEDTSKYKFVHHTGEVRYLTIQDFKDTIYNSSKVNEVASGKRRSIKGWFLNEAQEITRLDGEDPKIYTIFNLNTKEELHGTRSYLMSLTDLSLHQIGEMVRSKMTSTKGWKVIFADADYYGDTRKPLSNTEVYTFQRTDDSDSFTGTRHEFNRYAPLSKRKQYNFRGMIDYGRSSFGWSIISSD